MRKKSHYNNSFMLLETFKSFIEKHNIEISHLQHMCETYATSHLFLQHPYGTFATFV
jgi:hypothetical protein